MPHLHIAEFKEIEFPAEEDGVSFNFIAENINHNEEKLISVTVEEDDFFLLVKFAHFSSERDIGAMARPRRQHVAFERRADQEQITQQVERLVPHRLVG